MDSFGVSSFDRIMHNWRPDRLIQVNFPDFSAGTGLPPAALQALLENV
jgi:hypothetical protein